MTWSPEELRVALPKEVTRTPTSRFSRDSVARRGSRRSPYNPTPPDRGRGSGRSGTSAGQARLPRRRSAVRFQPQATELWQGSWSKRSCRPPTGRATPSAWSRGTHENPSPIEHRCEHALRGDLLASSEQGRAALNVRRHMQRARDQNHNCGEDGQDSPHGNERHMMIPSARLVAPAVSPGGEEEEYEDDPDQPPGVVGVCQILCVNGGGRCHGCFSC
jgi:hypothetical protein